MLQDRQVSRIGMWSPLADPEISVGGGIILKVGLNNQPPDGWRREAPEAVHRGESGEYRKWCTLVHFK